MTCRENHLRCLMVMLLVLLFCAKSESAPLSVQEWIAQKSEWKKLIVSEKSVTIEGRVSMFSRDQFRLSKCQLLFRSESGRPFKRSKRKHFNVLVTGYLKNHQGKPEFQVTRMYLVPSDLDEFYSRRNRILKSKPEKWFALSKWAKNRAMFYGDKSLRKEATKAWVNGVKIEKSLLKKGDANGLFELANKFKNAKQEDSLQMEYKHTGYRYLWEERKKKKDHQKFLALLAENFPGCKTPLEKPEIKLSNSYTATPIKTYQSGSDESRQIMHRLFYREILLPILIAEVKDDPRIGYEIAKKIDQQIPEEKKLAEQLREKELAYRMEHIQTASRKQLLNLKQKYLERKQPQQAEFVVQKWLAAREVSLRKEGASGLRRSARLYIELKNDKKKGVQLLLEAFKINKKTKGVAEELTKLGYHYYKNKWLTTEEFKHRKIDPIQLAMQSGTPIPGMTREQVEKTLGAPTSKYRMLSSNAIIEIWVFGENNETRITVHFSQPDRQTNSAKVIKVIQIQPH
ncbi:hypothetical protein MNBD_PLANCTO02-2312 [hydrothermal vent metagenome]|uniref:Uncharacterized protein n=1 Tax=hydrothermal vent metagenome TaxID=652676 RepID=A0A3B1DMW3_9ZZZZ